MTSPEFPMATGDKVHYAAPGGYILVWMTPEKFLSFCPPLGIPDEESDAYIQTFVKHIRDGFPLDAPQLDGEDHDGRHRATAARIAGVKDLPVMVEPEWAEWLLEMEFARRTRLPDVIDANGDIPWQD